MDLNLKNRTALVTASTGGIGLEIATGLAQEGATVILNGRSSASLEKATGEIMGSIPSASLKRCAGDAGTKAGCETIIKQFPEVDILVNNLGIYEAVGFFDESDESWFRLFEINIMSGVRLSRHYLERMLARGTGRIVFMSSESGLNPAPEMAHYSATKTMQLAISRSLAELTKGTKVTVNSVLPGSTKTEGVKQFVHDLFPDLPDEEAERRFMGENRSTSLIQRLIAPNEVADLVAFVCSDRASAINGAALRVDGGIVRSVF
jgi:3-oxoacyl-[acyl-carrier protein] reductase